MRLSLRMYPMGCRTKFFYRLSLISKRNTDALEISRIVRNDTATILYMDAYSRPNYWIRLASELSLHGVQSGKKYPVIRSQGFELDKQVYMPASGNVTFTLQFAPIDPQDRTIDFVESNNEEDFRIEGICLDASVPKRKYTATWPAKWQTDHKPVA